MSFIYDLHAFWNSAPTVFNGIQIDVSNGLSGAPVYAAGSKLLNLKNNGTSVFNVDPNGNLFAFNVLTNTIKSVTSGPYSVLNTDKGLTLGLNGGFFTVTFGTASGFDSNFQVYLSNQDDTAGKIISINGTTFMLWPRQVALVINSNSFWYVLKSNRWKSLEFNQTLAVLTFYVNPTTGLDTNDGLVIGRPVQHPNKALTYLANEIDLNLKQTIIQLADGTYGDLNPNNSTIKVVAPFVGQSDGLVTVQGNNAIPTNVIINGQNASAVESGGNGSIYVKDMKVITNVGGQMGLSAVDAQITFGNIDFGVCGIDHMYSDRHGLITPVANWTISAGALAAHIHAAHQGNFRNVGFSGNFTANCTFTYVIHAYAVGDCTFQSGNLNANGHVITGARFRGETNATIHTATNNLALFPGTTEGTLAGGASYDQIQSIDNFQHSKPITATYNAGVTFSVQESALGLTIRLGAPGAPFTDITPTAAQIVAFLATAITDASYIVTFQNQTGQTQTINGGAGVTMFGNNTLLAGATRQFLLFVTNAIQGSEAVTYFNMGAAIV